MSKLIVTGTGVRIAPITPTTPTTPTPQTYVRNPSWPACEADAGDNRLRGLYAVWPQGGNFFAAYATGSGTPAYSIDFGDGSSNSYNSATIAYHEYDYNNAALDGTNAPVTFTAATNTVNRTAHGYSNGMQVRFYDIATTTGIQEATPYYVTNATSDTFQISYNSYNSFGVFVQENNPQDMFFKPDGTKLYVIGTTGDDVNEYDLSIAWDLSTAIFLQTFSVQAQETFPTGLFFKSDGTKMYVIGQTTDAVYEYDLGTAWDVSSASYLQTYTGTASEASPTGLFFKHDGTKLYVIGSASDGIREYDLSVAWDVSTATFLQAFSVASQENNPQALFFKPDGTKLYIIGLTGDTVYEYDLGTAWDISTASYLQSFQVGATGPISIFFKPDGTKMYIMGSTSDTINAYNLSTAWDISTASVSTLETNIVDFTNDGSAALLPYKIATVTISPTSGQTLAAVDLKRKHNQSGLINGYSTGWLDIAVALPSVTSLLISSSSSVVEHGYCERVRINQIGNLTSMSSMFYNMKGLKKVVIPENITTVTNTSSMFFNCHSLYEIPLFNTSAVTNMGSMFSGCNSIVSIPFFDTGNVVNSMSSMFNGCYSLVSVPHFDTSKVISMSSMFSGCASLLSVPLFDTSNNTSMSSMFNLCSSLTYIPAFNTDKITNMSNAFAGCLSITSIPAFNTSLVTSMANMFQFCSSLISVPFFDTSNVTNTSNMFYDCRSITSVPFFDTRRVNSMSNMFYLCYSLRTVPLFETSTVTSMSSMFFNCFSLVAVPHFNTSAVVNMSSMFYGCFSLESVPHFDTSSVTSMSSMFFNCFSLVFVPAFDTSNVTNMSSMFSGCSDIIRIPPFNTSKVITFSTMFSGCTTLAEVPAFDMLAATSTSGFSSTFNACPSLSRIRASGARFSFTIANCKLSSTALNEIYTNLPTVTSATITVTGNYGVVGDDPTIATAKGWTVTG